jgi:hypothetical protein
MHSSTNLPYRPFSSFSFSLAQTFMRSSPFFPHPAHLILFSPSCSFLPPLSFPPLLAHSLMQYFSAPLTCPHPGLYLLAFPSCLPPPLRAPSLMRSFSCLTHPAPLPYTPFCPPCLALFILLTSSCRILQKHSSCCPAQPARLSRPSWSC